MIKTLKYLYLLSASLLIVTVTISHAETMAQCTARCKADVMNIDQCVEEERAYWEAQPGNRTFEQACRDLIRNEKLNCHGDCIRDNQGNGAAEKFYDKYVRRFPETN